MTAGTRPAAPSRDWRPRHAADEPGKPATLVIPPSEDRIMLRVRLMDGATAGAELAEQLRHAWLAAGRPGMGDVGAAIGYSKATVSRVLSGKTPPTWTFVDRYGAALDQPLELVTQRWRPLWIAADLYRARSGAGRIAELPRPGAECEHCGGWIADAARHTEWHRRTEAVPAAA